MIVLFATGTVGGEGRADPATLNAFDREMNLRNDFFRLERQYLEPLRQANRRLRGYQREKKSVEAEQKRIDEEFADEFDACGRFAFVSCPDPDYPELPDVPTFRVETKAMRKAAAGLEELRTQLTGASVPETLQAVHLQLVEATTQLKAEAEHNADVFDEAVNEPESGDPGNLDKGKIRTLRKDSALPAIRQMNHEVLRVIQELALPVSRYDVPGGQDLDPKDHSTAG